MRDLLIVVTLPGDVAGDQKRKLVPTLHGLLAEIGFTNAPSQVALPAGTFLGKWYGEQTMLEIRDLLVQAIMERQIPLSAVLVCDPNEVAWVGPRLA